MAADTMKVSEMAARILAIPGGEEPDPVSISVSSSGLITATDGLSTETLQLSTEAGAVITPGTSQKTAIAAQKFSTGAIRVAGDSDLVASNIKKDVEIFGVTGSYEPPNPDPVTISFDGSTATITATDGITSANRTLNTQAAKTVTPGTQDQVAVYSGRYMTGNVTVAGDADLVAGNIKQGVNIFGVTGTCATGVDVSTYKLSGWNTALTDGRTGWYFTLPSGCPDGLPNLVVTNNPLSNPSYLSDGHWQPGSCSYVMRSGMYYGTGVWISNDGGMSFDRIENMQVGTSASHTTRSLIITRETINGADCLVFTLRPWLSIDGEAGVSGNYHHCMCFW